MTKINRKRKRKATIKSATATETKDKVVQLQRVYTAARDKHGEPVIAEWQGVLYQQVSRQRWLLTKNPDCTAAFAMDAEKVFHSRTSALASLNMKKCWYLDDGKVVEGKMYKDGLGTTFVVSQDGHRSSRWTKACPTPLAAKRMLAAKLLKDMRKAGKTLKQIIKLYRAAKLRT